MLCILCIDLRLCCSGSGGHTRTHFDALPSGQAPQRVIPRPAAMHQDRRAHCALLLLLAVPVVHCAQQQRVLLIDAAHNGYLTPPVDAASQPATPQAVQGLVAALTGLLPGVAIDSTTSQQIASWLQPSLLRKPRGFLNINVHGVTPG
jgi:hypothetical protein